MGRAGTEQSREGGEADLGGAWPAMPSSAWSMPRPCPDLPHAQAL